MSLIKWRNEFSVGVDAVDHEHREMIALINELDVAMQGDASQTTVVQALGEIYARISAHFALEEKIMRDCRYDAYEDHKADHERLLDEISDIMERHDKDIYLDVETELAAHLREWFTAHFKTQDARLHKLLG